MFSPPVLDGRPVRCVPDSPTTATRQVGRLIDHGVSGSGRMIARKHLGGVVPETADLIAIVRHGQDASAVWHVDVAPSTPLMRLCGAWVTDDDNVLRNVVAGRIVLPFGGQLQPSARK